MCSHINMWYRIHIDVKSPKIILTWINTVWHISVQSLLVLTTELRWKDIICPGAMLAGSNRICPPSVEGELLVTDREPETPDASATRHVDAWFEYCFDTEINIFDSLLTSYMNGQTWHFISCCSSKVGLRLKSWYFKDRDKAHADWVTCPRPCSWLWRCEK